MHRTTGRKEGLEWGGVRVWSSLLVAAKGSIWRNRSIACGGSRGTIISLRERTNVATYVPREGRTFLSATIWYFVDHLRYKRGCVEARAWDTRVILLAWESNVSSRINITARDVQRDEHAPGSFSILDSKLETSHGTILLIRLTWKKFST